MLCDLNTKAFNDLVKWCNVKFSDCVNDSNNPGISAICIRRRTSNTGPRQEEQHANGNSGGQLKVGPSTSTINERWVLDIFLLHC